jgi:hypothetical protein
VSDSFLNSKRDKRLIKHSSFVSRVAKSSSSSASTTKRRRPNKKLVTTLESLGDALDDIQAEMHDDEGAAAGGGADAMDAEQAAQGKVRHKSLKSRPGALKRKEKLVKGEMERFGRSLAQLANIKTAGGAVVMQEKMEVEGGQKKKGGEKEAQASAETAAQSSATSGRWAALRGFISATMEQNPAFLGQT